MFVAKVDIGAEELQVDRFLEPAALQAREEGRGLELSTVHLVGWVRDSGFGYLFRGHLETAVRLPCSRCLETFRLDCSLPFDLIYREPFGDGTEESEGGPGEPEDPAISLLDVRGRIDLVRLAMEQIYLALPLKPLCRPDCPGLCEHCGKRRDEHACDCGIESTDPRWAVLEQWKKENL